MKTQIITIILILSMINLVSAYFPGESIPIDLNEFESYSRYTIEGNTSDVNILVDNLIATIVIPTDYEVGNFKIVFYGYKEGKEIDKPVHYSFGGGGSSSTTITTTENKTDEVIDEINDTDDEIVISDEEEKSYLWIWILVSVLIGLIVLIVIIITYPK